MNKKEEINGKVYIGLNSLLKISMFILGVGICIYIGFFSNITEEYKMVFLLPLFYTFFSIIFRTKYIFISGRYGLFFLNILVILKYVITPFIITLAGGNTIFGYNPSVEEMNLAFALMIYEMFIIFLVIKLFSKKDNIENPMNDFDNITLNISKIIPITLLIITIILIVIFPAILEQYSFHFDPTKGAQAEIAIGNSITTWFITRIVQWTSIAVTILFLSVQKKAYNKKKRKRYVYLSTLVAFVGASITGATQIESILILVTYGFILKRMYKKDFKGIMVLGVLFVAPFFGAIILPSVMKIGNSSNAITSDPLTVIATSLQTYLSGPKNVGVAVKTYSIFNKYISFGVIFEDLLRAVPIVAIIPVKIFKLESIYTANQIFNQVFYNRFVIGFKGSQIVPMIGQGYLHFGYVGAPIYTAIVTYIVIYFDNKFCETSRLEYCILYLYISLISAWGLVGYSMSIYMHVLFSVPIPIMLFYFIGNLFRKKRRM